MGDEDVGNDKAMVALVIICILMFIQGMAKAPRQALSSVYIDNNSAKVKTGFYIGVFDSVFNTALKHARSATSTSSNGI